MTPAKENLLLSIAGYTEVVHQTLESANMEFDERMIYLGHLGMAARLFKSICLDEPKEKILQLTKIESSSFKIGTPNNKRGRVSKESWMALEPRIREYL